jgi:hypothetical protein
MRIINLRIDDKVFEMIEKDKRLNECDNWESYIQMLFNWRKTDKLQEKG